MLRKQCMVLGSKEFASGAPGGRAATWVNLLCALLALALAPGQSRAYTRAWFKATDNGPRSVLAGDGVVVYQNKLWAIDIGANVVAQPGILSSSDGIHWTTVLNPAPAEAKYGRLVAFKSKLWIFGRNVYGQSATLYSTDGVNWTRITSPMVSVFESSRITQKDNKLWLFDSTNNSRILSSSDGLNWTVVNNTAPCLKRYEPAMVSLGGKLWLLGGSTTADLSTALNDVWSSPDGITWTPVTSHANWSPRVEHAATVFEGKIWILGGYGSDVWNSANGKDWGRVNSQAPWLTRSAMSPVVFGNRLWIFGGFDLLANRADAWFMNQLAAGAPTLGPVAAQQAREGQAYTGPDPLLTGGSEPITWSLTNKAFGMTIEPATGIVHWAAPRFGGAPYQITIKATNSAGSAQVTWSLTVTPNAPRLSAPAFAPGTACKVSWTAVSGISGYLVQRDDAPDFASPMQSVTVSSTTLERTFTGLAGGQTNWFRVRGIRRDGVTNAWSNVTSTTQDTVTPIGTIKVNGGASIVNSSAVTLNLQAQDPGTRPSGVAQMRLSTDGRNWMGWEPYAVTHPVRLNPAQRNITYYAQFQDRVGNLSAPASVSFVLAVSPICVDASASASGANGSPAHPYPSIRQAITAATATRGDIYVTEGTYSEALVLKSNMMLLGGFPQGRFDLALRSPGYYKSQITSAADTPALVAVDRIVNAQIDGFRIGNHSTSRTDGTHFGIYCNWLGRECIISHCIISGITCPAHHQGENEGGGIFLDHSSPLIVGCTVENCTADIFGGIACHRGSAPLIDRCLVRNNYAYGFWTGGGPFRTFIGGICGGVTLDGSNPVIRNSIFSRNLGDSTSAGIYQNTVPLNVIYSKPIVQNCTISGSLIGFYGSDYAQIINCIFWGSTSGTFAGPPSVVQNSCIQGWSGGGTGNITVDPQFVNAAAGDYHLKPTSPCIDAGKRIADLTIDFDGTPRGITGYAGPRGDGSHYDMGAYEYWLPAPVIAPATGAYNSPVRITMTGPSGATIRYTLDGTLPTENTPPYTGPITWPGGSLQRLTVTARAFTSGLTPSAPCVRIYTFR